GQAALHLSRFAKRVVLVVRGPALTDTMSQYLTERITSAPNIVVRCSSQVVAGRGNGHLEAITLADRESGTTEELATQWLFVFIGAPPRPDGRGAGGAREERGYVVTGPARARSARGPLPRPPFTLETSVPGVFAAGDVRLDSMKRVASAVG